MYEHSSMRFLDGSALLHQSNIILGFLPAWRAPLPAEFEQAYFERLEANLNRVAARAGELALTIPVCYKRQ